MAVVVELNKMISTLEKELGLEPNAPIVEANTVSSAPQPEKKKKEKKKKEPKAAAIVVNQPEITKLDMRVGKIVRAWKHETANKLYCEQIDVGEDELREIASGLVYHYPVEEMQNRRVVVLCNLKARNLVGFKSHGMVMCAAKTQEDGTELVRFVEPPVDAKVGERIMFEGLEGEPITPAQVEKKKVLDKLGESMKTDNEGIANCEGYVFSTSAGPCTASSVTNGVIR